MSYLHGDCPQATGTADSEETAEYPLLTIGKLDPSVKWNLRTQIALGTRGRIGLETDTEAPRLVAERSVWDGRSDLTVGDGPKINDSAFTASAPATIGAGATAKLFQHTGRGRLAIGDKAQAASSRHAGSGLMRIRGEAVDTYTSSYASGSVFVGAGGKLNGCTVSTPSDTVVMPGADIENSQIIADLNISLPGTSANGATISEPYNGSEREESMISVFNQGLRGAVSVGSVIFPGPVPDQPDRYTVQGRTTASDVDQALRGIRSCLPEEQQQAIASRLSALLAVAGKEQKSGRPAAVEDGTNDEAQ